MTRLRCFVVDAFTARPFAGNPAAVVPLSSWLPDATLQSIAAEMNLSETAFFVAEGEGHRLRWFTPRVEVDLCGHATLASAFALMTELEPARTRATFATRSGPLVVTREGDMFAMDFPSRPPRPIAFDEAVARALGARPVGMLRGRDVVCVFERGEEVRRLTPDFAAIAALPDTFAVCVTAPGDGEPDFVSRFFAPAKGVPEDPVTGSAHCTLAPYWAERLGKTALRAAQVGPRGGALTCTLHGDRVTLGGRAVLVVDGTLHVPE